MKKFFTLTAIALAACVSFNVTRGEGVQSIYTTSSAAGNTPISSFEDILFWVGEGPCQSAMVIDFQDGNGRQTFVWGFRWDPEDPLYAHDCGVFGTINAPTGAQMMQAIVNACNDLNILGIGPGFITRVTYTEEEITHDRRKGEWILVDGERDYYDWRYYIAGGIHFVYDQNDPFNASLAYPEDVEAKGGESLRSEWTVSESGLQTRYLEDGSWDYWVFTLADGNYVPLTVPSNIIYAAVPEPTTCALMFAGGLVLFALRRKV